MSEERCENCRFWKIGDQGLAEEGNVQYWDCRRRSPFLVQVQLSRLYRQLNTIRGQPETFEDDVDEMTKAVWPSTCEMDWCGEWQAKDDPPPTSV